MKKLLSTLILMAFALGGVAQTGSFAPQGAEWYFNLSSFMGSPYSYYRMAVEGDTIIQGHSCSVITRQFLGGNGDKQYVYEENRKVYWYNQTLQAFTTLYDFNAEAGDSWICEIDSCAFTVNVSHIDPVTWEGHTYRMQHVTAVGGYESSMPFYGYIIDGIGYEMGFFPDPYACSNSIYDGQYPNYLRCYLVDGELLYHQGSYDCDEYGYCWDGTVAETYAGGNGTPGDPYRIATAQQLALLAQQTNDGTGGDAYYLLTENISLASCTGEAPIEWTSIGKPVITTDYGTMDTVFRYFTGHFDGQGFTIYGLHQEIENGWFEPVGGLFGCTNKAEISNVNLQSCHISGQGRYVGGLVGYAGLTNISNCSITQSSIKSEEWGVAGGLVGCADLPFGVHVYVDDIEPYYITNCLTDIATWIEGSDCAGGIVGQVNKDDGRMPCVITNCTVRNRNFLIGWSVTSDGFAGGIVGWFRNGTINDCLNQFVVMGSQYAVGGIAGEANNTTIENCTNEGEVRGTHNCGGIVGRSDPEDGPVLYVHDCTNKGKVTCEEAEAYQMAGGIVGSRATRVMRCVNKGDVYGYTKYGTMLGGIVGGNGGTIANCYNRGTIFASYEDAGDSLSYVFVGGIVGGPDSRVFNVYEAGSVYQPDWTVAEHTLIGYGQIVGYEMHPDNYLNSYWFGANFPANGHPDYPELPGSSAFSRSYDSIYLFEPQYGTTNLLEALNYGAEVVLESVPEYPYLTTWLPDTDGTNIGFPVLGPSSVGDEALNAYCEAPVDFYGWPNIEQGTCTTWMSWQHPLGSKWVHYDEKPYAGSVWCNYWGIKIPAEEIQSGDVLTHVAFYKAGFQNHLADYVFAFSVGGDTEPDNLDFLPGNTVQIEPGPDEWVMVELRHPIECEEGKSLWIILTAPNVEVNNAAYCQTSGNSDGRWASSSGGYWYDYSSVQGGGGDWMIRGYFNNWGYCNEDFDHYNLYRGRSLEELEKIAELDRETEEYNDTLQNPFGDYYYSLTASYTDGRESDPEKAFGYFHVGNISSLGSEWYYEIQNEIGNITYQHLEYAADTTVNHKDVKIIIRTNTLYDKGEHNVVTKEYIYEDFGKVYWWNETLQDFTLLYDLGAQIGDEWVIEVGTESITMHVDTVEQYEYEGTTYRMLHVSDAGDLFSGTIMSGIGHLTSFFPERLMNRRKGYRVEGIRCYWRNGELVFKYGDKDCDEVYQEYHNGIEEDDPSTGLETFVVYPNPTKEKVMIEGIEVAEVQIYNALGQVVRRVKSTNEIGLRGLTEGMYWLRINDKEGRSFAAIVVVRE